MAWTPEYRRRKIAEDPQYDRKRNVRHRYGISSETFREMFAAQSGACAL